MIEFTDRIIIERSERGHVVAMDPRLVLRARLAIRRRRDTETEIRRAA
jgi:hypothetical protein